jgi:CDP-6-deoxy-D-xylo-4-hexulose-3-dehydrase
MTSVNQIRAVSQLYQYFREHDKNRDGSIDIEKEAPAADKEQLKKFDEIDNNRKNSRKQITDILLNHVSGIKTVVELENADTCWFGSPFICESKEQKDKLVSFLEENKIQTRNYFAGNILLHPAYKHLDDISKYPNSNIVLDKVFFLGASPHYSESVFEYIKSIFNEKWVN